MSVLATSGLRKTYRNRDGVTVALDDVSLEVAAGEFLALVGPSGCGKSTLLRTIAGLVEPDRGQVRFGGVDVTALPAPRRRVGFVFQGLALFEHLDVRANIAYGIRGVRGAGREAAVRRAAGRARIDDALGARPRELSGGQRQRVALARALAAEPQLLLLDEPFTGLDAPLRADLRAELGRFVRDTGTTSLIVTHDHADALGLGDRVAVMRAGAIVQIGTPREVYTRPASAFVGGFVGAPAMRFLSGAVRDGAFVGPGGLALHGAVPARAVRAGVRAEAVRLDPGGLLHGRVAFVEALGDRALAHVDGDFGTLLVGLDGAAPGPAVGDAVALSIDARRASYFDAAGERC